MDIQKELTTLHAEAKETLALQARLEDQLAHGPVTALVQAYQQAERELQGIYAAMGRLETLERLEARQQEQGKGQGKDRRQDRGMER
jgi:hypothetical protein